MELMVGGGGLRAVDLMFCGIVWWWIRVPHIFLYLIACNSCTPSLILMPIIMSKHEKWTNVWEINDGLFLLLLLLLLLILFFLLLHHHLLSTFLVSPYHSCVFSSSSFDHLPVHSSIYPPFCHVYVRPSILTEHRTFGWFRWRWLEWKISVRQCVCETIFISHCILNWPFTHFCPKCFISNDMCEFKCQCTINTCFRHVSHLFRSCPLCYMSIVDLYFFGVKMVNIKYFEFYFHYVRFHIYRRKRYEESLRIKSL